MSKQQLAVLIPFIVLTALTLALCCGILLHFGLQAQEIATQHPEPWPQITVGVIQLVLAAAICVPISVITVAVFRHNRKRIWMALIWFSVPVLLTVFALLYMITIVPCPVCNSLG